MIPPAQPADYDSDDSQVKKKIKVAALEWQGQTFYVTGKESALHILRETYSVRSLMDDSNCWSITWEILLTTIQFDVIPSQLC